MPVFRTLDDAYKRCEEDGCFRSLEDVDIDKIKSDLDISKEDFDSARILLSRQNYNSAFKLFYDVLHTLAEALIQFDKVKSSNHQCLFAHLCKKYKRLEFSWEFFEKIRTKRNGINYYGKQVTKKDCDEIKLQHVIYMSSIIKDIESRMV